MKTLARFVLRWAGMVSLICLALSIVGGYFSVKLYKNLRTDLEELLPTTARSVVDLGEVTQRLESIDNLAILIFSQNPEGSRRFVDDLAAELKKVPKSTIASVEYKIDRELQFFKDRRMLYMDLKDLIRIRDYIGDRVEYEKSLYNPLNIFSQVEIAEPELDLRAMRKRYDGKVSSYSRFPDGYYATPDGTKRVILAYLPGKSSGVGSGTRLKKAVTDAIERLGPRSYAPDIEIKYSGGVQNTIEEQAALVADLELSTVIVVVLVTFAMWFFYRAFRATAALMLSLFMGTLWTFGVAYFAVGYLNANSAFLGSIVIGNGINFGIILLARYMEERRKGLLHPRALMIAMRHSATATSTAALAAGLSYGSLMLTGFRGFNQFGIIGLIGMVLCWISAFTALPALLTLFDRISPLSERAKRKPKSPLAGWIAARVSRRPGLIWGASFAVTLISLGMLTKYDPNIIETDLKKLRNKESMEKGSGYLGRYVDEIFQRYLTPIVVLPTSRENAREIAQILKDKKAKEGKKSLIASVQTLDEFVPRDQTRKIQILHEIRNILPTRILARLSPQDQAQVREFLNPKSFVPIRTEDIPELVLSKFREKDGSIGNLVLVEPPLDTLGRTDLIGFIRSIRESGDSVEPGVAVAGTLPISSDMIESISEDGPRATLFAFTAVVLLVIFIFRNAKTASLVLFSLILGVVWMVGSIFALDIKINFLNFIALPITFGIGVDYGVNIFQRYREEGGASIVRVIRDTGGAVGLCSFTTMVGYGSLLIAQNQAFVSFGILSILGEVTCLLAAIFALPAYLLLRDRRKGRS